MRWIIPVLLLSGCAAAPISETELPEVEVAACRELSERHPIAGRAALRAGVEAARAGGVAVGIIEIVSALGGSLSMGTVLPPIVLGYGATSAANGAIEAQDRRDAIVRECLRDRGHKVY